MPEENGRLRGGLEVAVVACGGPEAGADREVLFPFPGRLLGAPGRLDDAAIAYADFVACCPAHQQHRYKRYEITLAAARGERERGKTLFDADIEGEAHEIGDALGAGRIGARRFPPFASLARDATWYRNATTVTDHTSRAVPAILSGERSDNDKLPVTSDYPDNLFTLLGFMGMYAVLSILWIVLVYRIIEHGPEAAAHHTQPEAPSA